MRARTISTTPEKLPPTAIIRGEFKIFLRIAPPAVERHETALWSQRCKYELRQACRERGLSAVGTKELATVERQGWRPTSDDDHYAISNDIHGRFGAVSMIVPTLIVAYYRIYEPLLQLISVLESILQDVRFWNFPSLALQFCVSYPLCIQLL